MSDKVTVVYRPTAVYDANEGFYGRYPLAFIEAYCDWLDAHGLDKTATYRVEHYVIDAPLIRVFQVDKDDQGLAYLDEATNDIARRKPFDVLIRTPPPKPEDYT